MKVRDVLHVIAGTDKIIYKTRQHELIDYNGMTTREKNKFRERNVYLIYPQDKRKILVVVY